MTTGFGTLPFGIGYAGLTGVPPTATIPAATSGSAFVDQNGDYQLDGTGDVVKTTATAQRAMLLLRTELASILADSTLGFARQDAIDSSWEYRMQRSVETALLPMTSDGTIEITSILISRPLHFRALIEVSYTVLATGEQEIAKV